MIRTARVPDRILGALVGPGGKPRAMTVQQIARALDGVSEGTVRTTIGRMRRRGLVTSAPLNQRRNGRPPTVYTSTDALTAWMVHHAPAFAPGPSQSSSKPVPTPVPAAKPTRSSPPSQSSSKTASARRQRYTMRITDAQIEAIADAIDDGTPAELDAEGWSRILRCHARSVGPLLTAAVRADVCRVDRIRAVGGDVWRVRPVPANFSQPRRVDVREEAV